MSEERKSGVNEPYCAYDGPEAWAGKKRKAKKSSKFGLNNETYFCARCVDCCLFSTTFARGDNEMPLCPLGSEPRWVEVSHSWIKRRMAFVLSELQESLFKELMKNLPDTSAEMEPDESIGEDD